MSHSNSWGSGIVRKSGGERLGFLLDVEGVSSSEGGRFVPVAVGVPSGVFSGDFGSVPVVGVVPVVSVIPVVGVIPVVSPVPFVGATSV
jgi:hypothetical protein